jgi:hypothetical protein
LCPSRPPESVGCALGGTLAAADALTRHDPIRARAAQPPDGFALWWTDVETPPTNAPAIGTRAGRTTGARAVLPEQPRLQLVDLRRSKAGHGDAIQ